MLILLQHVQDSQSPIRCASCKVSVGTTGGTRGCIQLDKWSLCIRNNGETTWEEHQTQNFVCSRLLALIESQAIYKYIAYSGNIAETGDALLVSAVPKVC